MTLEDLKSNVNGFTGKVPARQKRDGAGAAPSLYSSRKEPLRTCQDHEHEDEPAKTVAWLVMKGSKQTGCMSVW